MWDSHIILIGLGILIGVAGLVSTLVWSDMVALLNQSRPTDDQIPFGRTSWRELEWWLSHGGYWRLVNEFHRQYPTNRLYIWLPWR